MGLARAQPALGPGPGDRAGWGRPRVHEESGPACKRAGDRAVHPPPGGARNATWDCRRSQTTGRGGGGHGGGVPGAEIRVN